MSCTADVTIRFLRLSSDCSYIAHTPIRDGIPMDRGARWHGNTDWRLRVAAGDDLSLVGRTDSEDSIITTLLGPTSMSHAQDCPADEWVEPSDGLLGTAVFDATGDKSTMPSWDELVRQHADRVYRLAYRLSGNQHDAEDLTQETFIRVFRSVQNYQPGTFEGWLHRITTNLFLDMVRRRARIRMEALPEDYDRVPADEPRPRADLPRFAARPRPAGGPGFAAAGVPRRGRAVRHRGPVLRGDRRHPGREARHRAQPHPPRTSGVARLPGRASRQGAGRTRCTPSRRRPAIARITTVGFASCAMSQRLCGIETRYCAPPRATFEG